MTVEAKTETRGFETEVNQLLDLMIHSLYSNKEIFMRELISNASDACDKLRFQAVSDDSLYGDDSELKVKVAFDKEARTITITDNGIGMTRDEVIDHIGTIAKSGTKSFLSSLTGDESSDAQLIGQFGVGFYSSFIVADEVTLKTRKAGDDIENGVSWTSKGKGEYDIQTIEKPARGTEITLHLREDEDELLNDWKLRSIITQYSDHISFPVLMDKVTEPEEEGGETTIEEETVNQASALWTLSKSDISDDEYKEFYKHVAHDFEDPLDWIHNRVEGTNEYTSLLYLPKRAPFDLYDRESKNGIKLYVQRVFILEDSEQLMPKYLRFVRGLVDSNSLSLNVSREILQSSKVIDSIRNGSVKKILTMLEKMAKNDPEKYQSFWNEFGKVLKEGPGEDFGNKEKVGKLMRFASTHTDSEDQNVSLDDYISRMNEGQEKIYYIAADTHSAAKNSPHLEIFRKKGIEVLLLSDRVDEWLTSHFTEYDGKSLQSVAKGELDLDKDDEESKKEQEKKAKESEGLIKRMKDSLGDKVEEVRISTRLTSSPACIVLNQQDMAMHMQRLMKEAGHELPGSKPILEINTDHPIVKRLEEEKSDDKFSDWSDILFDQAILAEGGQLDDPASFVHKLNEMLVTIAE
ncbi:MAG: molecular chaperone HtpG [Gammaproteobacteria bacterium]|jgi:molecular chaperone HtpG|nr:molecular chaperone HtpG [Gammaproteobacteria bacterium]MBT3723305.1 molecular chaperone HtpG [Gammaproteobacteria bacterium]MBT4194552.1 molecular chaperone HtpG [Gammaproteobacteria bacterium]MBT4449789.1 molecular chaperone HtpG [Gammaproteobacteria bacterium]MBT4859265.1 molecular chaperone HtpG [Gammaproteobacteria bacterium]